MDHENGQQSLPLIPAKAGIQLAMVEFPDMAKNNWIPN